MKNRRVLNIAGILIIAGMLAGCAKTPESSLVRQKGAASLKNYEEGETLAAQESTTGTENPDDLEVDSTGTENSTTVPGDASGTETAETPQSSESSSSVLRSALRAPEHYSSEVKDETGKLQILTDADVEIPEASKVSAISVSQHPLDQALMDQVTEAFLPDAVFYSQESYYQPTKPELQKKLEELKGYLAEGNLDPYGYGTDEDGNLVYDIYNAIENAENAYEEAPEEKQLQEVPAKLNLEKEDGQGGTYIDENRFMGTAKTEDGKWYDYAVFGYSSMPVNIRISRLYEEFSNLDTSFWAGYGGLKDTTEVPDEETIKNDIGISFEEAKKLADEKVAKLNIPDMVMGEWEYALLWNSDTETGGYTREKQIAAGYQFHYVRKINKIPITYTMEYGGGLESMESEMETWCYEVLDLVVNADGVEYLEFDNRYDEGEVKTENLKLLSFDEIMKIYEKMMLVQNADTLNYEQERIYHINRITFGYTRIYEPASDPKNGILVPAWDFFGGFESTYEGVTSTNNMTYQSYLTINAIDGSIIDRNLGY